MKKTSNPASTSTRRLHSRPVQPTETGRIGLYPLGLDDRRDGLLYVPAAYQTNQPVPLLLMLHGADGDLFAHILAFSPGFMAPITQVGAPQIFISHGTQDRVLPIDRCSRRIVPQLQEADYEVLYREFDGSHTVPNPIA